MPRLQPKHLIDWRILCCLGGIACAASPVRAQMLYDSPYTPDWERHFRIGVMAGFGIKASFNTSGQFNVSGSQAGATGVSGVDHLYNDGYVRVKAGGPTSQGVTWFWGYDNASQYDGVSQLSFHDTTSYSTTGGGKTAEGVNVGMDVAYGGTIKKWETVRLGWDLEIGFLPISLSDNSNLSATADQNVYAFDTGTITPPDAPYAGTFDGPGALIHDQATLVSTATGLPATITGTRKLDLNLFTVSLGPSLYWDASQWVGFAANAGPAVGFVTGEYRFDETVTAAGINAHNSGHFDVNEVVFGGTIGGQVMFHVAESGDLYLGVKYMPLSGVDVNNGGRHAKLDMSGAVYISTGFNWPF